MLLYQTCCFGFVSTANVVCVVPVKLFCAAGCFAWIQMCCSLHLIWILVSHRSAPCSWRAKAFALCVFSSYVSIEVMECCVSVLKSRVWPKGRVFSVNGTERQPSERLLNF